MTNTEDARGAMESTLATSSSAMGPVTFSHVFGQQCQLMEAGRTRVAWVAEACASGVCPVSSVICNVRFKEPVVGLPGVFSPKFLGHATRRSVPFGQVGEGPGLSFLSVVTQRLRRNLRMCL